MSEQKKHKNKSTQRESLQFSLDDGIQCSYVRFQSPVAPNENKEPVFEFKLKSQDPRYKVDQISHTDTMVYWKLDGIIQTTPYVNVQWSRPILD